VGASQREVLEALKRRGPSTVVEALGALALAKETLREHLEALVARGFVVRTAARRGRPGRPEIVYALAPAADALFPRRESAVLADLVRHLLDEGRGAELKGFFEARAEGRLAAGLERLAGLRGKRRLAEVARILSDDGFMAEIEPGKGGRAGSLRLCHCPVRDVVAVTALPCGAEMAYVRALLGKSLTRVAYLPDGDASCTYRLSASLRRAR
jgi:predicted ArsR family transcriptional regulator